MNFDAYDILRLDKAAPGLGGVGLAGEGHDSARDHRRDDVGLGAERAGGGGVADDEHPGIRGVRGAEEAWIGEAEIGGCQTKRLTKQKEREYDSRHDATMGRGALQRFATRTLAGARMLTTSKPHRRWRRPVMAAGLILFLSGCTPPGPRALLEGERLIQEGRQDDAIRRLRTAVEFLPGNAQAWNHLGLAYHGAKRPTEASEAYQQALRLDRNLAVAYFNSGCLYLEHGEPMLATDALWAYVGLQPRVVEGWVKLGQAQLRTRKWDQAERSFAEALRLNPARVDALNGLGVALQQRRKVREAWQSFTNAVMRDPGFAPAWMNLGVIAQQTGANAKAVQAYRQYASLRPDNALQMDLAAVIRKLESPPPAPSIQLPPAPQTNRPPANPTGFPTSTPPPTSLPSEAATGGPPSGAGLPAPGAAESIASSVTPEPGQARPPPRDSATETPPDVAENRTPVAQAELPPTPISPPTPLSTTQEVSVVSLPSTTVSDATPSVAQVPADPVPSPAAPPESESPDTLVLPTPTPVPSLATTNAVASADGPRDAAMEKPLVPVDRVELPPSEPLVMGIRDEVGASLAGEAGAGAAPSGGGLPPLVRPVASQRATPGTDRDDKRGFWSRANPVSWFGSDTEKPGGAAEPGAEIEPERAAGGSSTWRWANPASWFRGASAEEVASRSAGEPGDATKNRGASGAGIAPVAVPASGSSTGGVVMASLTERAATNGPSPTSVRRAQAPAWAARPVSTKATRVPDRELPLDFPRYTYRHPERPVEGNRIAAKGILAQAQEEHRRDRAAAAIRLYEEALQLDPALAEAHQDLAVAAMQLGDLPRALAAGETALVLQPQALLARLNFGLALDRAGFPVDAAAETEKVVAAKPDHVAAHLLLGNLYAQKLGRPEQARGHYLRVIELEPEHPQSVAIRRWLAGRP